MQQKAKEAMEQFESASKVEKDRDKLAQIYHNMGVILQSTKQYPQCIDVYKRQHYTCHGSHTGSGSNKLKEHDDE